MVAGCSPILPTCSQLHTPPIRGIMSTMATLASPQKITFAEMRESGARGLLVYCAGLPLKPVDRRQCRSMARRGAAVRRRAAVHLHQPRKLEADRMHSAAVYIDRRALALFLRRGGKAHPGPPQGPHRHPEDRSDVRGRHQPCAARSLGAAAPFRGKRRTVKK